MEIGKTTEKSKIAGRRRLFGTHYTPFLDCLTIINNHLDRGSRMGKLWAAFNCRRLLQIRINRYSFLYKNRMFGGFAVVVFALF